MKKGKITKNLLAMKLLEKYLPIAIVMYSVVMVIVCLFISNSLLILVVHFLGLGSLFLMMIIAAKYLKRTVQRKYVIGTIFLIVAGIYGLLQLI